MFRFFFRPAAREDECMLVDTNFQTMQEQTLKLEDKPAAIDS